MPAVSRPTSRNACDALLGGQLVVVAAPRGHALAVLLVAAASSALAADPTGSSQRRSQRGAERAVCIEAHRSSQVERKESRLLAAREQLLVCAQESCPGAIRSDCAGWLDEVGREIPSIVVRAVGDDGDITDVGLQVDVRLLRDSLDGRAVELDPGAHTVVLLRDGAALQERTVLLGAGERNRLLEFDLRSPAPPIERPAPTTPQPPVTRQGPVPLGAWISGGAAVVATAAGVSLFSVGFAERLALAEQCAPFCKDEATLPVRLKYAAADAAFAVAIVSAGVAGWLFLSRPDEPVPEEPSTAQTQSPSTQD